MTKLNLEQMEADRKAGTQGEFYISGSGHLCAGKDTAECRVVSEDRIWSPNAQHQADARRIVRVPQLEAMVSDMAPLLQEVAAPNWQAVEPSAISRSELPEEWQEYIEEMETHFCAWQISSRAVLAKHVGEA